MISDKGKVAIIEKYISRETTADTHKNEMRFYNLVKLGRREEVLAALERKGFEKNVDKLTALYEEGYRDAESCYEELLAFLKK